MIQERRTANMNFPVSFRFKHREHKIHMNFKEPCFRDAKCVICYSVQYGTIPFNPSVRLKVAHLCRNLHNDVSYLCVIKQIFTNDNYAVYLINVNNLLFIIS
jgi:hypothetical protein